MINNPFNAVINNDIKYLENYLELNNINIKDNNGNSLLHYAVKINNKQIFQLLINSYIDIDIANIFGETVFHYAVLYNRLNYLKVLFTTTANAMTKDNEGRTPLYLACRYRKEKIIDLYLEKYNLDMGEKDNNEETIFFSFVRSKSIELINKYNNFISYINEPNYIGETPLMIACKNNSINIVKLLLEYKVLINQKNKNNETAIFYAVKEENKEIIELLIKNGAFLDFINKDFNSIYDISSNYIKEYIDMILNKYNLNDYKNKFILHYAIYLNDDKLIENNLNIKNLNIKDYYNLKPIDIAVMYNKDVIKKIKKIDNIIKIEEFKNK